MKRLRIFIFLAALCACPLWAHPDNLLKQFKIGGYISNQYPAGDIASYTDFALGLGANVRFMLPVENTLLSRLGFSVHAGWQYLNPCDSNISSFSTLRFTGGVFYDFPIGNSGFSIQPEIGYGVATHFLQAASGFSSYPEGVFCDQVIEFSVLASYSIPGIKHDSVEIFAAPVWSLMPEQDSRIFHLFGFRAGFLYSFQKNR